MSGVDTVRRHIAGLTHDEIVELDRSICEQCPSRGALACDSEPTRMCCPTAVRVIEAEEEAGRG